MKDDVLERLWELVNRVGNVAKNSGNYYFSFAKTEAELQFWFAENKLGSKPKDTIEIKFPMDKINVKSLDVIETQLLLIAQELKHTSIGELGYLLQEMSDGFGS